MREIFADSFYWIALANPKDQWHQAAKDFSRANQEATLVTTDEVLVEFLNYFAESGEHARAVVAQMCAQAMRHSSIIVQPKQANRFWQASTFISSVLIKATASPIASRCAQCARAA